MNDGIEELGISRTEVQSKLEALPRGSMDRAILRMLSAGVRPGEISVVSELSAMQIRQRIRKMFPEKDVNPHEFRKLLGAEVMASSEDEGLVAYVLDHRARETTELLTRKTMDGLEDSEMMSDE